VVCLIVNTGTVSSHMYTVKQAGCWTAIRSMF